MKKRLSLTVLMMVMNYVLTPFSYIHAEDLFSDLEVVEDVVVEEVVEENVGEDTDIEEEEADDEVNEEVDDETDESDEIDGEDDGSDVEVNTGDTTEVNTGDTTEVNTGDTTEVNTGDTAEVNTGDTAEVNTGDTAEVNTGDTTEINTGDTAEINTGDTTEVNTGDTTEVESGSVIEVVEESIEEANENIEALKAEELEAIWNNLNVEEIKGQDNFKNVIVSVEAPIGSFPEGTELRISPITTKSQQQEIKDQLVENTDVTEESELVSFDISFIYTLSFNGEEIELQPLEGKTVKVSFNYVYNDVLTEADNDSSKELKVYHLEEVVDDEGNKTEEVEVKEIKVNEKESSEGELVIDADKFSVYSVVDVKGATRGVSGYTIMDQMPNFTWNEVKIEGNDGNCLWVMDRDLGATSASTSSVGYFYQWGNNYGFTASWASGHNDGSTAININGLSYYSGDTFIKRNPWHTPNTIYLWGGSGDNSSNSYGYPLVDSDWASRQGPCPQDWHVPSRGEWEKLKAYDSSISSSSTKYKRSSGGVLKNNDAKPDKTGQYIYWTSTPSGKSSNSFWYAQLSTSLSANGSRWASFGVKVRCFKNTYSCDGQVVPSSTCSYNGTTYNSGDTLTGYSSNTVPYGQNCSSVAQMATCQSDGSWNVNNFETNYPYTGCTTAAPANCTLPAELGGGTLNHGSGMTVYSTAGGQCPTSCTAGTITCNNGTLEGNTSYTNTSCTVTQKTCSASTYPLSSCPAHGVCNTQCVPYTVSGNACVKGNTGYALDSCDTGYTKVGNECKQNCTLPAELGGGTLNHGSNLTVYSTSSATCPDTCTTGSVACNNGILEGNTSYTNTSCTTNNYSCNASEYPLAQCDPNGTCSACISYTANGHSCTAGTTIYKLNSCNTHYHKNGNQCDIDTFTATINVNESNYGSVDVNSVTDDYGTAITSGSNTITIGSTTVTATATGSDVEWIYEFSGWNNTCGSELVDDCTITAEFSKRKQSYTVHFSSNNTDYGNVDNLSSTVEYGAPIIVDNTNRTVRIYGGTTTAIPAADDNQYDYEFEGWTLTNCGSEGSYSVRPNCEIVANFSQTVKEYTVTIESNNTASGTVTTGSITVPYGTSITTGGKVVTIGSETSTANETTDTDQYDYSFDNWTTDCGATVTNTCTVTANFSSTVKQYDITFIDEDGTELKAATKYNYGTPAANIEKPSNPTKPNTAQWTYSFAGWSPTVADVVADAIYRATYSSTLNTYTITWLNSTGTELEVDNDVPYGATPSYDGNTPTSGSNAQYSYSFTGWMPAISSVEGDVTYTATYDSHLRSYLVKFVNYNGTELQTGMVYYGDTPTYTGSTATRPATQQYTYSFSGWNPSIAAVEGPQVYTATFSSTVNEYLITWLDGDGEILKTEYVAFDEMPSYIGDTPTKTATQQYTYTFNNTWTPEVATVTGDATYTANFDETVNQYTATITASPDGYGKVNNLSSTTVTDYYGSSISTNGNTLTISGTTVTATPTAADAEWTYSFVNWTNNCGNTLTGDCTITANFTREKNQYQITFNSNGGSSVETQTKYYGETVDRPTDPTKDGYDFAGWYSNEGLTLEYNFNDTVTQTLALYAKWTPHVYSINYTLNGGTVSQANPTSYTIESGNFTLNNPTRVGYEFSGWTWAGQSTPVTTVTIAQGSTGNRTYVANWEAIDVTVTVNHYTQDLTAATNQLPGTYTKDRTTTSGAKADSMIQVENYKLTNVEGFTYSQGKVGGETVNQTRVLPDGSLVIDLYYTRNSHTFTLTTDAGSVTNGTSPSGSYYYGSTITLSGNVTDCYMWNRWAVNGVTLANNQQQTTFTMPDNNVSAESLVTQKTYNIAFNGNTHTSGTTPTMEGVLCTATVPLTANGFVKTGYTFTGWSETLGGAKAYNDGGSVQTLTTENGGTVTLYAIWEANTDTPYTVNHWYLDVNGERTTSDKTTEDLSGTTAASVTPAVIGRNGFTSPATQTVTIAADGSTVVDYDYTRKSYRLTFVTTGTQPQPVSRDVIYGGALNVTETSAISGYTFLGWSPDPTNMTMPANDLELTATWSPDTVGYKVEHYRQNINNDNYVLHETENKTGTTDTTGTAVANTYEGFTYNPLAAGTVTSGNIAGNGSLVLKLYYTRNSHTVTFVTSGGTNIPSITARYGSGIAAPADPTRDGYNFNGWDTTFPITMPDENVTVAAQWTPKTYTITYKLNSGTVAEANPTNYTIESSPITLNNPTRVGYTFLGWTGTKQTEATTNLVIPTGSTGERKYVANWQANSNIRLTVNHYIQDVDAANNSVLATYTKARTTTYDTGTSDAGIDVDDYAISIDGFTYNEGKVDGSVVETTTILPDGSRIVDLYYTRNKYSFALTTLTGSSTNGTSPSGDYYYGVVITLSGDVSGDCYMWNQWNVVGTTITNNKQTTFNMPANTVTAQPSVTEKTYNIAFNGNTHTSGTTPTMEGVLCTATVALTANGFVKTGYTFTGWSETLGGEKAYNNGGNVQTLTTENGATVTLYAIWEANKNTPYTVVHKQQNINGNAYVEVLREPLEGTTDDDATVTLQSYAGFEAGTYTPATIKGDGSTIIEVLYDRKSFTITFDENGGNDVADITAKFDAAIDKPADPTKQGYEFSGWNPSIPDTMPAYDQTIVAEWRPADVNYTVEHRLQSINDESNYVTSGALTEILVGKTEDQTQAAAKNLHGFTAKGFSQETIAADESTVVVIEYTRNSYTVSFNSNEGSYVSPITAKYESGIAAPANPTREGYEFVGWYDGETPVSFPYTVEDDTTLTAHWDINQYTITFDSNGGSEVAPITQDYNTTVTAPADPTREGFTFAGWQPSVPTTMPANNTTVVAQWNINSYKIRFVDGSGSIPTEEHTVVYSGSTSSINYPTNWEKEGYTLSWSGSIPATMPAHDVYITGNWTIKQYTITFNTTGSTVDPIEQDYGTTIDEAPVTSKYGYDFAGWYDGETPVSFPYTIPASDKTFTAHWTIKQYTVTFDSNGGSAVASVTEDYLTQIPTPTDPTRNGYTFTGWYRENNSKVNFPYQITENVTFHAVWDLNTYTIGYDLNGGSVEGTNPTTYNVTSEGITLINPTREGYNFLGWTGTDVSTYNSGVVIAQGSTGDRSYVANWEVITYTIDYTLNGGTVATANPTSYTIESEAITLNNPTRAGYTFRGWTGTDVSTYNSGVVIAQGSIGDRSYIANWQANTDTPYKVEHYRQNIDNDNYTIHETGHHIGTTDTTGTAVANTYEGFTYNPSAAGTITSGNIEGNGSLVLKLYYTRNTHTITFVTSGGTNIPAITARYGSGIVTPADPTRDGYDFAGWDKTIPTAMPDEDVTITAQWTPKTYTIRYTLNSGTVAVANPTSYTIESETITLNNPEKVGYTFLGWTGTKQTEATTNLVIPTGSTGDRSYVANWDINQYTITFDSNGGSEVDSITQDYDTEVTAPADPTRNGYTFQGWNPSVPATMPAEDIELTAQWNIVTYNIAYDLDGGSLAEGVTNPETYTVETNTFRLNNPTKYGYDFVGWDDGQGNVSETVDIIKGSTGDRNYTATYNVHEWQLTFESDGVTISSETVAYGSGITAPADPTRNGYTFQGWNPSVPATMPDNNLTISATWEVNKHNVTYVSEGVTFEQYTNVAYGSTIPTTGGIPTKVGHHFIEWTGATALNATMPDNDVTYTAVFEKNDYVVELSVNPTTGGSVSGARTYKYGDSITVTATENYGFTFSGWKVGNEFVSSDASYTFTADDQEGISLVAVFDINSYTVNVSSSNDTMGSVSGGGSYIYKTQATLEATANQGYHFVEWRNSTPETVSSSTTYTITVVGDTGFVAVFAPNTDTPYVVEHYKQEINGTYPEQPYEIETLSGTTDAPISPAVKTYDGFTSPSVQSTTIGADGQTVVKYYYTRKSYTITFNTVGGSTIDPITKKYDEAFTAPADPTKEGYSFDGWDKTIPGKMPAYNQTITAQWKINQYTITFDSNGGSAVAPITQDYNTTVTAPADPIREGYTFTGWDREIPTVMPAENITITAGWRINQYTITFDSNGGSAVAPITQDYNTTVTAPADPTRAGYHFDGWNRVIPTKMPAENITITGLWTANTNTPYKVKHYRQNIDDNNYTLHETEDKTGTTDQQTAVSAKTYDGFTAQSFTQVNIDGDGEAVVEIRYTRNSYTLSFNTAGGTAINSKTLKYEQAIPTIETTIKTGYHLSEILSDAWIGYPVNGLMPAGNLELTANWQPDTDTPYYVKHYLQNLDGTYPEQPYEIEDKTGTTDASITPAVKTSYNGYIAPATQTTTISPYGDTVVEYQYARQTYTITYNTDGGTPVDPQDVIFGGTILGRSSTKVGYDFGGWSGMPDIMPDHDVNVKAIWTPSENTPYKVQYYLEKVNVVGNIEQDYVLDKEESLTGVTDHDVSPCVYVYTGFVSPEHITETIKPDGSLVIKYYYIRSGFELSYNSAGGTAVPSEILRFGETINAGTTTRQGYTFIRWDNLEATMPAKDLRLVALWDPNDNTPYTVEHHIQNLSGDAYVLHSAETLSGTTDTDTAARPKDIPGFTSIFNIDTDQKNIDPDGQQVVIVRYNRNSYNIIYNMNGGDAIGDDSLKYEAEVQPVLDLLTPHRLGYNFVRWSGLPTDGKMPAKDLKLRAEWSARSDTKYIVRHFKENVTPEGTYDLADPEVEVLEGVTDSEARPNPKTYMGFRTPEVKTGTIIAVPEGQTGLVIDYYYNRSGFTLTYNVNGGVAISNNPRSVRFEETIDTGISTTRVGYIFGGWSNVPADGKMPAEPVTLTAIWTPDDVNYTVEHKFQSIDNENVYELSGVLTETKQGKTESQTQAVAKDIPGFTAQSITQQAIAADGSTVIEVKYTRNTYTISFNENGGSDVADITAKYGSGITAPADPTKLGYTFDGWNPSVPATMPAKNMELLAQWLNNVYTVSFNANGGEGTTASMSATYDQPFMLTANGFSRLGYTFSGWSLTENGVKVYNNQHVVTDNLTTVSGYNVVLYAVWDLDTYTIGYNLNGGSVEGTNPTTYNVTSDDITLINPTKNGYTFQGWTWTGQSIPVTTVTIPQGSVGDRNYVANWEIITYHITYDENGGDPVSNPATYNVETPTFTLSNPTRAGYAFDGWTGTNLANPSDNVIISKGSVGDRNYVANWTANDDTEYTVKHYKQNIDNNNYTLADSETLSGTTDTSTAAAAKTYEGFTAQAFSQKTIKADDSDLIEIYYNRNYYDVTVVGERGIASVVGTGSYRYGKELTVTVNVKDGYTIDGVKGHKDYPVKVLVGGVSINPTIDVITYNIGYNLNGGIESAANPDTYNVETTFTLNNPTKEGYTFEGWTGTDVSVKTLNVTVNSGSIGDRAYVANWVANTNTAYTVKHWYLDLDDQRDNSDVTVQDLAGTTATEVTPEFISRDGFSNPVSTQTITIAADGSSVVNYEYRRITYTVTYDAQGNIPASQGQVTPIDNGNFKYGATINPPALTKAGYHFDGWSGAITMPAENTGLIAKWTPVEVTYTVKHFKEKANDNGYTEVIADRQTLSGVTEQPTEAAANTYEGFATQSFSQQEIKGDGTTIIEIRYSRNTYTISFNENGGSDVADITAKYEANLTAPANPTKDGYTFKRWEPSFPGIMPLNGGSLTAIWEANTGTQYTIKHYLAELDGSFPAEAAYTDTGAGVTDQLTDAQPRVIAGFINRAIQQKIIRGEGDTVVNVYYDRNEYTVTYDAQGNIPASQGQVTPIADGRFVYGAAINPPTLTKDGYHFDGWIGATEVPASDVTITAQWTPVEVTYTVRHLQAKANDNGYTEVIADRQTLSGVTEQSTEAAANTYDGFTAKAITQKEIMGDGSTVVDIYYDRNPYELIFDTTGTNVASRNVTYGRNLNVNETSEMSGYTFLGWSPDPTDMTMPLDGLTLTATWEAHTNTPYVVKHYQQNIANNGYTLFETDNTLSGTTDTLTEAVANNYDGFTAQSFEQIKINGDTDNNITIVEIYYNRNVHTVTYDSKGGSSVENRPYKYGATIQRPTNVTKDGYDFVEWSGVVTMPDHDVTLEAIWVPKNNTHYTVEHYQQNIADDNYTEVEEDREDKIGTTDADTEAVANTYDGFTAQAFNQEKIAGNGSTIVRINYNRNEYTITFETSTGTNIPDVTGRYGATVPVISDPELSGYTFKRWSRSIPETIPASDVTITAIWEANTNTPYSVNYYQEQLDGSYVVFETDELSGTTDTTANATIKNYEGFTYNEGDPRNEISGNIDGDESQVLSVYYTRNTYEVSYQYVETVTGASALPAISGYKYEQLVTVAPKSTAPGYTFSWNTGASFNMPARNVIITGTFVARNDTKYVVEYYEQQADGNYPVEATRKDETRVGTTDTTVSVTDADKTPNEGYAFDSTNGNNVLEGNVNGDGSLILRVYFKKQFIVTYKQGNKGIFADDVHSNLDYGVATPEFRGDVATQHASGYTFEGWTPSVADNVTDNAEYIAQWSANTGTKYTVRYIYKGVDDEVVDEIIDVVYSGTTDTTVNAPLSGRAGFIDPAVKQVTILGNESASVTYVYERDQYDLSYDSVGGTSVSAIPVTYGALNYTGAITTRAGYAFVEWTGLVRMPVGGTTLTAVWQANTDTPYKVEHYRQNIDNDNYAIHETGHHTGTTDTTGTAVANTYEGFTYNPSAAGTITSGNIAGNGSLVLRLYYTRNTHTITFVTSGGTNIPSITARYGSGIATPADPEKDGYDFAGWDKTIPTTMPDEDVIITAQWTPKTYTITYRLKSGSLAEGVTNPTSYTIESNAITLNNPSRTGYTFLGWTGTKQTEATTNLVIPTGSTGDRIYVANWQADNDIRLTVNHYTQDVDAANNNVLATYTKSRTTTFDTGTADAQIDVDDYKVSIDGFTYSGGKVDGSVVTETTILPDGSRVIDLYYIRNQYTFTLTTPTGSSTNGTSPNGSYYYGAIITLSGDVSGDCYMWNQWNIVGATITNNQQTTFSMPANTVIAQPSVTEKTYNIAFNGNTNTSGITPTMEGVLCTATVSLTANGFVKTGYTFTGWSETNGGAKAYNNGGNVTTLTTDNGATVTLYAIWEANTDTPYTVNHWYLNVDGQRDSSNKVEQPLVGTSDAKVTPAIRSVDGFNDATPVEITISPEGNTVLDYEYIRKSYPLIFDTTGTIPNSREVIYGGVLDVTETSAKSGYTFLGWNPDPTSMTMPLNGLVLTATWSANTETKYHVQYYQEQLDGSYVVFETDELSGTTDTTANATIKNYEGFTYNEGDPRNKISGNIDGDESQVLSVYYTRNTYEVSYQYVETVTGASALPAISGYKYEQLVTVAPKSTAPGYTFSWNTGASFNMPARNVIVTGTFVARNDTKYTVKYVYKGTDDGISDDIVEIEYVGTTDTEVDAPLVGRAGFIDPAVQQVTILGDESAETIYVYERTSYTLAYNSNGGTPVDSKPITYGALNDTGVVTIRTGYTFVEWTGEARMPLNGTVLTAIWRANTDTPYTVKHMKEQLDGSYVVFEIDNLSGTTDTSVTPSVKTYEGFTAPSTQTINIDPDGKAEVVYNYSRNSYALVIKDKEEVLVDTMVKYGDVIVLPADPIWTGHVFMGWNNVPSDGLMPAGELEITSRWDVNQYTITFDTDGGSAIAPITADYGTVLTPPADPIKDRHHFIGWSPAFPETMPAEDMVIKALWEPYGRSGRGGNGGSGEGDSDGQHGSADDEVPEGVDPEVFDAYKWAYQHGITTMDTLELADPDGYVIRGHLAKMVVNFAVNVLGREVPAIPAECHWKDKSSAWESQEIKNYAEQACALGVMGIYMEEFLPNKVVDRGEFGTVLSRLLWGSTHNVIDTNNTPYYEKHLLALKDNAIMTQIDHPLSRKELRKRVWVMLRRVEQEEEEE